MNLFVHHCHCQILVFKLPSDEIKCINFSNKSFEYIPFDRQEMGGHKNWRETKKSFFIQHLNFYVLVTASMDGFCFVILNGNFSVKEYCVKKFRKDKNNRTQKHYLIRPFFWQYYGKKGENNQSIVWVWLE